MGPISAIKSCFKKYITFSGRASRSEYWWWQLFAILAIGFDFLFVIFTASAVKESIIATYVTLLVYMAFMFFLIPPSLAVAARRLHDINRSFGWYFIIFIPLIGPFVFMIACCFKGTTGANRFGDDPLGH